MNWNYLSQNLQSSAFNFGALFLADRYMRGATAAEANAQSGAALAERLNLTRHIPRFGEMTPQQQMVAVQNELEISCAARNVFNRANVAAPTAGRPLTADNIAALRRSASGYWEQLAVTEARLTMYQANPELMNLLPAGSYLGSFTHLSNWVRGPRGMANVPTLADLRASNIMLHSRQMFNMGFIYSGIHGAQRHLPGMYNEQTRRPYTWQEAALATLQDAGQGGAVTSMVPLALHIPGVSYMYNSARGVVSRIRPANPVASEIAGVVNPTRQSASWWRPGTWFPQSRAGAAEFVGGNIYRYGSPIVNHPAFSWSQPYWREVGNVLPNASLASAGDVIGVVSDWQRYRAMRDIQQRAEQLYSMAQANAGRPGGQPPNLAATANNRLPPGQVNPFQTNGGGRP